MALKISNLCKEYKEFCLEDINMYLPKGYIMGLVGKNGAGKSTTIRSILNMQSFNGEILVNGWDNRKEEIKIKQTIGAVVDYPFFPVVFTLEQVEKYIGHFYCNWDKEKYYELLKKFGLSAKKKVGELSRGMGVKLQLAVALSHHARILILDEPTSGLDPVARDELMDILMDYMQDGENSILFSTHICSDLEKIADYITILCDGKVFYSGEKEQLLEQYLMIKGDDRKVTEEQRKKLIGIRIYGDGFDAMIHKNDFGLFQAKDFVIENAKIDEILIYAERGTRA